MNKLKAKSSIPRTELSDSNCYNDSSLDEGMFNRSKLFLRENFATDR